MDRTIAPGVEGETVTATSIGTGGRPPEGALRRHADVVVVGGGMAGLGAADAVLGAGRGALVLEAADSVGGLARGILVGGEPIEPYYHHIFPQDREAIELIGRLGLADRLEWLPGSMGVMHEGHVHAFDSPLDVLRFAPLPLAGRVRLAAGTAGQLVRRDAGRLARTTVGASGPRWFGRRGYDLLWRPMLEAKFGEYAPDIAMAWLAARIRQRAGARGAKGDRLGYLRGSLGTLAEAFAGDLRSRGAGVETSMRVRGLRRDGDRWLVDVDAPGGAQEIEASAIVACLSGPILTRLVELPDAYRTALGRIPYRGIVCALLELSRPLGDRYWVNVTDRLGLGCVGIIEHTNLVPADRYGGRSLVYLAHYVDPADPAWTASPDGLLDAVEPALRALNPAWDRAWVLGAHVSRDRYAQPVPIAGGPMPTLPVATGLPGLVHASLAHVFPDDRGVSMALRLGARAAREAMGSTAEAAVRA